MYFTSYWLRKNLEKREEEEGEIDRKRKEEKREVEAVRERETEI